MFAHARAMRSRCVMTATIVALTLTTTLTNAVSAETTHEANQAAALLTAAPSTLTAAAVLAQITDADGTLRFEIAEDGTGVVWAGPAVVSDRLAASGAPFLTQGYIYPAGTLSAQAGGVNADGSPQFPEKVLGQWSSYGWYLGDGARTASGPWVLATQIFQFGSEWGAVTLVSEGYVAAYGSDTVDRAVTGGTGPFTSARGEMRGTMVGINESAGSNARYEVRLWTP